MDTARIAELLEPYLTRPALTSHINERVVLTPEQLNNISIYVDVLLKWNARVNLTAIREPEEIVRRHFGESFFVAHCLFPDVANAASVRIIDVGSGAGFPGLPIKLWAPQAQVTLIEANNKKVTFLREVIRTLTLIKIDVFPGRAEEYQGELADVVTLRAVEKFSDILPTALELIKPEGKIALLIGESQSQTAKDSIPMLYWDEPLNLPGSQNRVLLLGKRNHSREESGK